MTNKEAIEIFSNVKGLPCGWCCEGGDEFKKALDLAIKALEDRPHGKWKCHDDSIGTPVCNKCGKYSLYETNFCPNCGADMRGEQDE